MLLPFIGMTYIINGKWDMLKIVQGIQASQIDPISPKRTFEDPPQGVTGRYSFSDFTCSEAVYCENQAPCLGSNLWEQASN